ncbi:MAG: flagellar protein FliT [Granulosicoccus sp.]|nr:flagellar protein FliT [Granulosicoccus sp.]
MTAPLSHAELASLVSLMQGMLDSARSAQWDTLSEMDQKRLTLLKSAPQASTVVSNDDASSARQVLIERIRILDREIIDTVISARGDLVNESHGLRNQLKARNNYAQASSLSLTGSS